MPFRRPWIQLFTVTSLLAVSGIAAAQSATEVATRRDLLEQAQTAREHNDHAIALNLADRAGRIQMTPSVRLFIAEEHATLGHVLEGLATARQCAREAEADPALRNRDAIIARCREVAQTLEAQTGRIVIRAPEQSGDAVILLDGDPLNPALVGTPIVVRAGRVQLRTHASGSRDWEQAVDVAAGATVTVQARLGGCDAPGASGAGCGGTPSGAQPAGGIPAGGVVVAGAGVLVLGLGAVMFVLRDQSAAQIDGCETGADGVRHCFNTTENQSRLSSAHTFDTVADVALAVGAAALVGGGLWAILGRGGSSHERASAWLAPTRDGGMLGIGGVF